MSDSTPSTQSRSTVAFSTPESQKLRPVKIYINRNETRGSPDFDGKVGDTKVALYIRNGVKGTFLSLTGDKQPDGKYFQHGTANITCVKTGVAKLAIKMAGGSDTIWADINPEVPEDMLVRCGLDRELLAKKKAEAKARAAG